MAGTTDFMTKPGVRGHRHWIRADIIGPCEDPNGIIAALRTNTSWNFYLVGLDLTNSLVACIGWFLLWPKFSHVSQKTHLCCCCHQLGHFELLTGRPSELRRRSREISSFLCFRSLFPNEENTNNVTLVE